MVLSSNGWVENFEVIISVVLTIEFYREEQPETLSYPCIHVTKFL